MNSTHINQLQSLLEESSDLYYNTGKTILKDEEFDELKELYESNTGKQWKVGATPTRNKIALPYWMGSMNKIKDDIKLTRWTNKYPGPYIITEKIDGVSCLFVCEKNKVNLYTRGNGIDGTQINWLIPCLGLDKINRNKVQDISIRGEIVMPIDIFQKKYKDKFANPRNMVSGIVNSKEYVKSSEDLIFIAYEIIDSSLTAYKQLSILGTLGIKTVMWVTIENKNSLTKDNLGEILSNFKNETIFEIDGLVVYDSSKPHPRNTSGNPDYAFAFKIESQTAVTEVKEVLWKVSKHGIFKPRLRVDPVLLSGVTITFVTGFNAKYIVDNDIGPGAMILVTRSGDVIPHIIKVIKKTQASLPVQPYSWNESGVDIHIQEYSGNNEQVIKQLTNFMVTMQIKQVSDKTVEKLIKAGFDTIPKLIKIKETDLIGKVPGIAQKSASTIVSNITTAISTAPLYRFMAASNYFGFGFGERRLKLICDTYPNILTLDNVYDKVLNIKGFSKITASQFTDKLHQFITFMEEIKHLIQPVKKEENKKGEDFLNQVIVFTGFRDIHLENYIQEQGGKVTTTVSKKTTLVVSDSITKTEKIIKAEQLNIQVISKRQFMEKLKINS